MTEPATTLLTLQEVSGQLGISLSVIEEWVASGQLASFKKGRLRRVSRADLTEFVLRNSVRPRRPDWFTPLLEGTLNQWLRDLVRQEILALNPQPKEAA